MQNVYLDYNSTTPVFPDIKKKMEENIPNIPLNPSSVHKYGQIAREIIENARYDILKAIFPKSHNEYSLIFTSSGSESNNLVINSFNNEVILYSNIEHSSIIKPCEANDKSHTINVNKDGLIDIKFFASLVLKHKPKLISIMQANNEIGVIQDINKISKICKENSVILHTDASQSFGKIYCNFEDSLPDLITISSHKIYGPIGASAVIFNKNVKLIPQILGGGQEFYKKSGTENVSAIYGFSLACNLAIDFFPKQYIKSKLLRDKIDEYAILKKYKIVSKDALRLPNTTLIVKQNSNTSKEIMMLDMKGIMASGGSACSSGLYESNSILQKIFIPKEYQSCQIRFSLGICTLESDIDYLINAYFK